MLPLQNYKLFVGHEWKQSCYSSFDSCFEFILLFVKQQLLNSFSSALSSVIKYWPSKNFKLQKQYISAFIELINIVSLNLLEENSTVLKRKFNEILTCPNRDLRKFARLQFKKTIANDSAFEYKFNSLQLNLKPSLVKDKLDIKDLDDHLLSLRLEIIC